MKKIELRKGERFNSIDVLRQAALNAVPGHGFTVDEMRRRIIIGKALDLAKANSEDYILLEDGDQQLLARIVGRSESWAVADAELLAILDAVLTASAAE